MERIKLTKNTRLAIWDVGGSENIRPLWRTYLRQADGIVFVVDSTDRRRMDEIKEELLLALSSCLKERVPVLIFANKQDLHYSMDPLDIIEQLELDTLKEKNPWVMQAASAKTGDGIKEGYTALISMIDEKRFVAKAKSASDVHSFSLTTKATEFI